MFKSFVKITALIMIVSLNWAGLLAIGRTFAYFNDIENSPENIYQAGTLDFSLNSPGDFTPEVTPAQNTIRSINISNDGILGFQYGVQSADISGLLCDFLTLSADLEGNNVYTGPISGFSYNAGEFSDLTDNWQFAASLTSNDPSLENQVCTFDFIFDGVQINGPGFSDQEIISNTVISGQWTIPPPILCDFAINEVYYDPDDSHQGMPNEEKFEWIELYNGCDETVNLQNWYIADNNGQEIINQNYSIEPGQFVVVAASAAVWNTYWSLIPENAVKIALGGNMISDGLDNEGDRVVLYDDSGNERDAVSWETDTYAFNPSVSDVDEGHSIARKEKGVDTDQASDWEDLSIPNPGINPHTTIIMVIPEIIEEEEPIIVIDGLFLAAPLNPIQIEEEPVQEEEPLVVEEEPQPIVEEQPAVEEPPIIEEQPVIIPESTSEDQTAVSGGDSPIVE